MPKIDLATRPAQDRLDLPRALCRDDGGPVLAAPGQAGGLTQFGVNIVILQPGATSSLRHWHRSEDEFVMITRRRMHAGRRTRAKRVMRPGDCAAFPAGIPTATAS